MRKERAKERKEAKLAKELELAKIQAEKKSLTREEAKEERKKQHESNDQFIVTEDSIIVKHTYPRRRLYEPKEETFPVPLKYIDVSRKTWTDSNIAK